MQAFWRLGYSGTSLDQLSDATDMNRPSMYAAFGDKHALYLKTLDVYADAAAEQIQRVLDPEVPLAEGLGRFYGYALKTYLPAGEPARGCYLIGTATTQAADDPEVRQKLLAALQRFDRALEARLRQAQECREIDSSADIDALTMVASAVLHTLAVRSRAGDSRAALQTTIDTAIRLICGDNKQRTGARRR
jgi:AcrR family transcriptional regulator